MATAPRGPAKYVILDMDAMGKSPKGESTAGMAGKRKRHIAHVLKSESPLVVFVQKFGWKGFQSTTWKGLDIPDHFRHEGHNEAGFIFDTREITSYWRIDNKTSVRDTYDSMVRRSGMDSDYFDQTRLCVFRIIRKGIRDFGFLCANWHGPHNTFSKEKKEKAFDTLVEFLLQLKVDEKNLPLLLGGDFNMPASTVKRKLPSDGSLMLLTPDDSSKDMFIMSPDIEQIFHISQVYTMEKFQHLTICLCRKSDVKEN